MLRPTIDVNATINSGQVFLWEKEDDIWYGINGTDILAVKNTPFRINSLYNKTWDYFRQEDDIRKIIKSFSHDMVAKVAIQKSPGLRVLRQDPFQCYISFITSSNSNIPRIKTILQNLCKKFGQKTKWKGKEFHLFPTPEILANAKMSDLEQCGFGYRSKSIKKAANSVIKGEIDFESLKKLDYLQAKEKLLGIYGIGNKVADCIMLFSLEKLEAFPLDRWMLKILQKYYSNQIFTNVNSLTGKKYQILHESIVDYFGPYAGFCQQFLFKMERDLNGKRWL